MRVDPRFSLIVEDCGGRKALAFLAKEGLAVRESATALFEASFGELCELAGVPPAALESFSESRSRTLFSNGWQSWSFAGELAAGERVRRARIVPHIAVYCDGPGPREARGELLSRFLTFARAGQSRLVLASTGSPDRATPPVSFRWDRSTLGLRAEVAAEGGRFAAGQLVAQIAVFYGDGYFAAKDALRDAFRDYGHFDRLGFLGSGGSLVPGGYESWYNHYTRIDEGIIAADLASIGSNDNLINAFYLRRGKPTVFQIDDGWERRVGEWEPDAAKFPEA